MPPNKNGRKPPATRSRGNEILAALQRQIGPLPAWAWALVGGVSLYFYRNRTGALTPASTPAQATDPSVSDGTSKQDPTTLAPGEGAYDPSTGALVTNPPDQLPAQDPITVDPGQSVYDPKTGKLISPTPKAAPKKPGKRKPKSKPQHAKPNAIHPHKGAVKPRKGHSTKNPTVRKPKRFVASTKSVVGSGLKRGVTSGDNFGGARARKLVPKAASTPKGAHKPASATAKPAPVLRQRAAAPAVTHPATQRVAPHPAAHKPAAKRKR